jgi:hypothetical protein
MSRIDKCSYCKVESVPGPRDFKAMPSYLQDADTSRTQLVESDMDKPESQGISMAEFGQEIIGDQYDQQLGYGYHELQQGSTVRLKQFKKIVLRDEVFMDTHLCMYHSVTLWNANILYAMCYVAAIAWGQGIYGSKINRPESKSDIVL